jgi:hypothetical protein
MSGATRPSPPVDRQPPRRAGRGALLIWVVTMLAVGVALTLPFAAGSPAGLDGYEQWHDLVLVAITNTTLGAVIVSRRPRHPIGWLLLVGSGVLTAVQLLAGEYAGLGPDVAPFAPLAAWVAMQVQFTGVLAVVLVFQLFPTGRPLAPRWRILVWATIVGLACRFIASGLAPGSIEFMPSYENPFGIARAEPALDALATAAAILVGAGIVGGLVSLGLRLHRSDGLQRQQVKVLFYAATLSVGTLVGANIAFHDAMETTVVGNLVWGAAGASLSLAVTIALLRYRLFDIDRLISRTVTYALVTAVLAAVYVMVAILPATLYGLESDLLVAVATLASVGIVVPVRRRVQAAVDRRFNRARYDAARTATAFAARLRDEVDLDAVSADLLGVVHATVQPAAAQVWLRSGLSHHRRGEHRAEPPV